MELICIEKKGGDVMDFLKIVNSKLAYALTGFIFITLSNCVSAETVLITGANKGIGFEFARQYAAKDWTVIATHRRDVIPDSLRELSEQYKNVRIERVDITKHDQIDALAEKLKGIAIDVLINNAGYAGKMGGGTQKFGTLVFDNFDLIMRTNGLGALKVSEAFKEHVIASKQKKIVALSSDIASFSDKRFKFSGGYWYKASKVVLHMFMMNLANDLKEEGVIVAVLEPGIVLSEKNRNRKIKFPNMVEAEPSIAGMIKMIEQLTPDDTGSFIRYNGERLAF